MTRAEKQEAGLLHGRQEPADDPDNLMLCKVDLDHLHSTTTLTT